MSAADYIRILRRSLLLIIALAALGGVAALGYAETQTKLYRSYTSAMIIYRQGGTTSELLQGSNYVQNNVQTYALLATSPYVLRPVIQELDLGESPTELGRRISVDTPLNTTILQIAVTDADPTRAPTIADAVTTSLTRAVSELSPSVAGQPSVRLETIAPATRPQSFVSPDRRLFGTVGVVSGAALALAIAFLREQFRSRPRNSTDIASVIDLPALGEIPRDTRLPLSLLQHPTGTTAEAVRAVAANLRFVSVDRPAEVIIVTSARSGDGKTSITTALGLTMAAANHRTLIVDADLRNPSLANLLGVEGAVGLTSVLVDDVTLAEAVQPWGHENLWVLTGGTMSPNPGQLISSGHLTETIDAAREQFDMVIIDTPPVGPVSDALWLSPASDGVILVARAGRTPIRALKEAYDALATTRAPLLGIILNGVTIRRDSRYHGKAYGSNVRPPDPQNGKRVAVDPSRVKQRP